MSTDPRDRFVANITVAWPADPEVNDPKPYHWIWTGPVNGRGYPTLTWYGDDKVQHSAIAYRVAYERDIGPIGRAPLSQLCDAPGCVNPHHWIHRRPTPKHRLVLTDPQAICLVGLYEAGATPAQLAERFGIGRTTVRRVLERSGVTPRDHAADGLRRRGRNGPTVRGDAGDVFVANVRLDWPKNADPLDHHWVWDGPCSDGYPLLVWDENGETQTRGAARWSYEDNIGPIPEGRRIFRRCVAERCVNPRHWGLGRVDPGCEPVRIQPTRAPRRPPARRRPALPDPMPPALSQPGPAARILSGEVPAWMTPHLADWAVLVGDEAYRAVVESLWPPPSDDLPQRRGRPDGGGQPRVHASANCYAQGCRLPECREAHRLRTASWRRERSRT